MIAKDREPGRLPVRVVKVGGSLFDWPGLPGALTSWLDQQPPAVSILMAGGGELADAIRQADAIYGLGEEAHWLCIDALSVAARLLAAVLKVEGQVVADFTELQAHCKSAKSGWLVFNPPRFLREVEPRALGCVLPQSWGATSDSIAARLAHILGADELVLLKSQEPPLVASLAEFAACGYVDECFPQAAAGLSVRLLNLRSGERIDRL